MLDKLYLFGHFGLLALLYLFLLRLAVILMRPLAAPVVQQTAQQADQPAAARQTEHQRNMLSLRLLQTDTQVWQKYGRNETVVLVGAVIPVTTDTHIGRAPGNEIRLEDPFASAFHARLQVHRQSILLEDLETTNGTRVNGMQVKGAVRIEPGDIIDIGSTSFVVEK